METNILINSGQNDFSIHSDPQKKGIWRYIQETSPSSFKYYVTRSPMLLTKSNLIAHPETYFIQLIKNITRSCLFSLGFDPFLNSEIPQRVGVLYYWSYLPSVFRLIFLCLSFTHTTCTIYGSILKLCKAMSVKSYFINVYHSGQVYHYVFPVLNKLLAVVPLQLFTRAHFSHNSCHFAV